MVRVGRARVSMVRVSMVRVATHRPKVSKQECPVVRRRREDARHPDERHRVFLLPHLRAKLAAGCHPTQARHAPVPRSNHLCVRAAGLLHRRPAATAARLLLDRFFRTGHVEWRDCDDGPARVLKRNADHRAVLARQRTRDALVAELVRSVHRVGYT